MEDAPSFTVIFEGDIRKFAKNPLFVETEFGTPYAIGVGDAFEKADKIEAAIEHAIEQLQSGDPEGALITLKCAGE